MSDRHLCLAGGRCRAIAIVDGKKTPATTEAPDTLCAGCERSVQRAVEYLPRDYVALSQAVGEKGRAVGQKIRLSPARQAPVNIAVVAMMQEIAETLDRAAEIVSEQLSCDPPEGAEAPRVSHAALMVSTNITKLLTTDTVEVWEWQTDTHCEESCNQDRCNESDHLRWVSRTGIEFGLRLRKLHTATANVIGVLDKLLKLSIGCADCADHQPLYQNPETQSVLCKECGRDWTTETFGLLGRVVEQRKLEEQAEAL